MKLGERWPWGSIGPVSSAVPFQSLIEASLRWERVEAGG